MAKWVVEMPKGWDKEFPMDDCPLVEHGCGEFGLCKTDCPLTNAKPYEAKGGEGLVGELEALFNYYKSEWAKNHDDSLSERGVPTPDTDRWACCIAACDILKNAVLDKLSRYHPLPAPADGKEAGINDLCKEAYETSKSKGWKHDNDGQAIALMHSELSEALEAMRKPNKKDEHLPHLNAVGLELADVLIRVFDFCGARGIDLATCVKEKMAYNKNRPMKHGGKAF